MTLPSNWTTKTVRVTYRDLNQQPRVGEWNARFVGGDLVHTIAPGDVEVLTPGVFDSGDLNLQSNAPSLEVDVPIVDDPDIEPQGGKVVISVQLLDDDDFPTSDPTTLRRVYELSLTAAAPSVIDLSGLIDPDVLGQADPFILLGVPGGLATLDGDGFIPLEQLPAEVGGGGGSITVDWDDVENKPATFAPSSHTHAQSEITGLVAALTGKAAASHTHAQSDVTGLTAALSGKASTSHSHVIADTTGLQTALDGKADDSEITTLTTAVAGKASTSHSHAESDITGLVSDLSGKASTSHTHTASQVTDFNEALMDHLAAVGLVEGTNVTLTYDDTAGTITIDAAGGGGGGFTQEQIEDFLAADFVEGAGIDITYNDGAGTFTIASTITQYTDENVRDAIGTALVQGGATTITVNDGADTITISSTDTVYTDENARDAIGAALVPGNNVDITVDDTANTITIDVEALTEADIASLVSDLAGKAAASHTHTTSDITSLAEYIRDSIGTALVQGTGITITVDDPGDTITVASSITQYTDEAAQDAVGAMATDTDTIDLTYVDATPAFKGDVRTQMSVTSDSSGVKLSGDASTPGNSKYYGTDSGGTKGYFALSAGSGAPLDIQIFTASGTWNKPSGGQTSGDVVCIGAGGSGGSGRRGAAASARTGGGGGAGGAVSRATIPFSVLGSTETVTVGGQTTGATGASSDSTNGNAGSAGTATSFGSHVKAGGGGAGGAGSGGIAASGGSASTGQFPGGAGGGTSSSGGVGTAGVDSNGGASGGGGAGGISTADSNGNSGSGGDILSVNRTKAAAVSGATAGNAGPANAANSGLPGGGGGGAGGGGAFAGGAGGLYGGGGGGGASSLNGTTSGAGGNGAAGICVVTSS